MNYREILNKYIENKTKLDATNKDHEWIIYNALLEIDINEEFLNNKTIFQDFFNALSNLETHIGIEFRYNKYAIQIISNLPDGTYQEINIYSIKQEPSICIEQTKDEEKNTITTIQYYYHEEEIKKIEENEINDYTNSTKLTSKILRFINQLGFYTYEITNKTVQNEKGLISEETLKQRDSIKPYIEYEKTLNNKPLAYGLLPDFATIDLDTPSIINEEGYETEEEIHDLINQFSTIIEENIEKNIEDDDGNIKEYYKQRYQDYPELINKYSLKKV